MVEYKLPKLGVASSNLVARSKVSPSFLLLSEMQRFHLEW
jgi:hypothetical protein